MQYVFGDFWNNKIPRALWGRKPFSRVITTNIGWDDRSRNNMGAGTALQALRRFPGLDCVYGSVCEQLGASTPVLELATVLGISQFPVLRPRLKNLVFFPVKPLKPKSPEDSWNQVASLWLIRRSLAELAMMPGRFILTMVGCGNGELDPSVVYPLMSRYLKSPRFLVVDNRIDWAP